MSDERDKNGHEPELQADEQERLEAEALAAALDGEPHAHDAPEDALATALLMRHGGARSELPVERSEAILSELLRDLPAHTKGPTAVPAARKARVVYLRGLLRPSSVAVLAAAAALMLVWRATRSDQAQELARPLAPPGQVAARPLPRASVRLLSAQSALLREGLERARTGATGQSSTEAAAEAHFELELRAYRADLFRTLRASYPAKLGWLESSARRPR